jgi:hypothetical protein
MSKLPPSSPLGHVFVPSLAIAMLSSLLAVGLGAIGILVKFNQALTILSVHSLLDDSPKSLPSWVIWLGAVAIAFWLSYVLLSVSGMARRWILFITCVTLMTGWGPVLSLAGYQPELAGPLIAVLWAGICALIYTANHRMPADLYNTPKNDETR